VAQAGIGFFYLPTVLVDVPGSAEILAEETFGPVAPIVVFDTEAEAVGVCAASARRSNPG
jgi:succinate-semialdehyde dehydrogenase/glutarate-semialdehyde dehydrogenase